MVVADALRRMYEILFPVTEVRSQVGQHEVKVGRVRLVGADVFGGIDRIELNSKLRIRSCEPCTIDVRQDHQAEVS